MLGRILSRTGLYALPQFFNVLRGDMSIVGPRPPIASEVRQYNLAHLRRLDVTPGITGLWQVNGRSELPFEEMVRLDLQYIREWSLLLDIKIILATPGLVVKGVGAY